jgi:hypothetical protein
MEIRLVVDFDVRRGAACDVTEGRVNLVGLSSKAGDLRQCCTRRTGVTGGVNF